MTVFCENGVTKKRHFCDFLGGTVLKNTFAERLYAVENFGGVLHTTLDPEGPGVVRIHMIPPKIEGGQICESVVILNGQDIIPVGVSWSILLAELIKSINQYDGREIREEEYETLLKTAVKGVKRVYPLVRAKRIKNDMLRILNTFKQIAYGETPDEKIGYMTLGQYAPFMRAPHRMDIMVSAMTKNGCWHCNQKCVHCYAAGQSEAEEAELSTEEWKKILDKLRKIGVPQVTFTGGEPTMRDDLIKLIDHAKWFVTRLNTNGIRLSQEYCKKLHEASLDSCQITFYSHDKSVHNRLVGADRYDDTVSGICNALKAGISVSINTPLCTLNNEYVKTLEFLKNLGVRYVTCSGLITTGNALLDESERLQLEKDEIKCILKAAVEYCAANSMEISFTSPGWIENSFFEELGITTPTCGAALSNMAITPGGHVVPCQSWLSGNILGDFMAEDWDKIWNSPACLERREYSALMEGLCPLRKFREQNSTDASLKKGGRE